MTKLPSPQEIEDAKTPRGGWTRATLAAWGVVWPPPRGWRKGLVAEYHKLYGVDQPEVESKTRFPFDATINGNPVLVDRVDGEITIERIDPDIEEAWARFA